METAGEWQGLQMRSLATADGQAEISLETVALGAPPPGHVVVKVEAAPINPSDLMPLLAGGDPASATFSGQGDEARASVPVAAAEVAGRLGASMAVGLEGAGTVVAAGEGAAALLGRRVAFLSLSLGSFAQFCLVRAEECMPLPDGLTAAQGADLFCNPMTALAMIETLHQIGERALVHTAAASNLGRMLLRACIEDGIAIVCVVRREEQADELRALGAEHVCVSSAPNFDERLVAAVAQTGARTAFDAVGGGTLDSRLLAAMEAAAAARLPQYSPYGSSEMKRVYQYGHLDPAPTVLPHGAFGMLWAVEGWAMPPVLARAGAARTQDLTERAAAGLTGTFASQYGRTVSLAQALDRETMIDYARQATGRKVLIEPWS